MSRPFDDTKEWWREEIRQLAQIVHQLHIDKELSSRGGWRTCRMASCSRIRDIIDDSHRKLDTVDLSVDEIVSVRVRRSK